MGETLIYLTTQNRSMLCGASLPPPPNLYTWKLNHGPNNMGYKNELLLGMP